MDQHNPNLYPINSNKNNEIFGGYVTNPCAQQTSQRQHFLPPYAMPMTNNMPQSLMYNSQNQPIYNIMYSHQTMYRNQNSFSNYPQESWQDSCVKANNYKDKFNTKKDNCFIETKNFYNYNKNSILDPQWYYGNYEGQKYTELPSCSQISNNMKSCCNIMNENVKSVKYCSIQKLPETDSKLLSHSKQYDDNVYINQYKLNKEYSSCSQFSQTCSIYSGSACSEIDNKILLAQNDSTPNVCDVLQNQYYSTQDPYINISKTIDKSDETNGNESDIIVENSEEDSEESENEKEEVTCLVCNIHIENITYDISLDSTTTTFTQTKVSEKLFQVFGWITIENHSKIICNVCMSLLNTFDNLEMQLQSVKQKMLEKYKTNKLCLNNLNVENNMPKKLLKRRNLAFKCRICKQTITFRNLFENHLLSHRKKQFPCKYCKKKCKTSFVLKVHIKKHKQKINKVYLKFDTDHKKINKTFICHICGKMFQTNSNLKEHENLCSAVLPFECLQCKKTFPSKSKMNQHIRLLHEKSFTDVCKICNKGFIKNSELKVHMLSHSPSKNYKCNICEKVYKTLSNLNQHKKQHREILPFTCKICQKGFLRKNYLEYHMNNHNGAKNYNCSQCNKKFTTQKYLNAHLLIHNGHDKKKTCNICGKQIKHGLDEHLRIHSNVKNFECSICLMKFLTKGALSKHSKRKHTIKK